MSDQLSLFGSPEPTDAVSAPAPRRQSLITTPQGKRVFVVDAYGLIYQVFHALPPMNGKQGELVNAVFGFMRDLFILLEKHKPDLLFCAFDLHAPTLRQLKYEQYKSQREKMPDELIEQIPRIRELLETMRIPILAKEGFEADDILATVAEQTAEQGGTAILVTSDKDCRQLISESVRIYSLRRDKYLDRAFLLEDWGIAPEQVVDYQAMVGDSTDNVPGIALIGPKVARELLEKFGTLDEILKPENLETFFGTKPTKRKENLLNGRETAMLCRELVQLDRHVPIEIDWGLGDVSLFDYRAAIPIFTEYAFRSMIPKAEALAKRHGAPPLSVPVGNADAKSSGTESDGAASQADGPAVLPEETASEPIPDFAGRFVPTTAEPLFLLPAMFQTHVSEGGFLPEGEVPPWPNSLWNSGVSLVLSEEQRQKLADPLVPKVGYDLKQFQKYCLREGIPFAGPQFDVMLAVYILEEGEVDVSMVNLPTLYPEAEPADVDAKALQEAFIQRKEQERATEQATLFGDAEPLKATKKRGKKEKPIVPPEPMEFLAYQAAFFRNLYPILQAKLVEAKLADVCCRLEFPLIEVLAEMECNGISVDLPMLQGLQSTFHEQIQALKTELYTLAGEPLPENGVLTEAEETLNLNSPIQLRKILFERLGLAPVRKTKTGASTDAGVLEELAEQHEFPRKLLEYRQLVKLQSTYVETLPQLLDEKTQRIHTTFNQAVTATGRLSSSDPNLQNIPVRTELGRQIRQAFVARPEGWCFVSADYSQIELRVLAHYCGDPALQQAFFNDEDIHTRVACEVFGVDPDGVTKPMRNIAKTVNFGIIYGQSPFGLAQQLGISQEEAQQFIQTYFEQFPTIRTFMEQTLDGARERGFVSTLLGRHRRLTGIRPVRKGTLTLPERMAVNTVIQGSAADLIKLAMLKVHARLHQENLRTRLLLQIHDELIVETPAEELEEVQRILREEMTTAWKLRVPLKVDVEVDSRWG